MDRVKELEAEKAKLLGRIKILEKLARTVAENSIVDACPGHFNMRDQCENGRGNCYNC